MVKGILSTLLLAATVAGCSNTKVSTWYSREEFVTYNKEGHMFTMTDTYLANRNFEQVVATMKQKAAECLDSDSTMTRTSGGLQTMRVTDHFRTTVRVVSPGRAELTTQHTSSGIKMVGKVPDGGYYDQAVDLERVTPTSTRLTYYGLSGWKDNWAAMKKWAAEGQTAACP